MDSLRGDLTPRVRGCVHMHEQCLVHVSLSCASVAFIPLPSHVVSPHGGKRGGRGGGGEGGGDDSTI